MRSDSVEAGWEACECDHVQFRVNQILEFFLAEILVNPASRTLFSMLRYWIRTIAADPQVGRC